ncbi:HNH endonuclease [Dyadobacter bucti]|uniref:HNH endonuclease n=1 Tax=Dyadobacter bucti TaxID=2572203 RepID=UPI003F7248AA
MRKIAKPIISAKKVFEDCISNSDNQILKDALTNAVPRIEAAALEFERKIVAHKLHEIDQNQFVNAIVTSDVLKKVYTSRMLVKKNPGRVYYDNILLSAPNGKCPLCVQRLATTLDHYLPKNAYSLLAVVPDNLIPACTDCNKGKAITYPTRPEEETLHPYFDDVENDIWLKMRVVSCNPVIFEYFVNAPANWTLLLQERVKSHFNSYHINSLYTTHAVEEFENNKVHLTKLFSNGGNQLLKDHLRDAFNSRSAVNKNSWQTAFYGGLLDDADFCNGAFL